MSIKDQNATPIPPKTQEELQVEEEHKIWKKNCPFLYDTIISHALEWPSLTVSWFPDIIKNTDTNTSIQRILLGTHTANDEPNHLIIAQVKYPIKKYMNKEEKLNYDNGDYNNYGGGSGSVDIIQTINHPGEVNRARYMPQNPNIISTKTNTSKILVYDKTRHPSFASNNQKPNPELVLTGHTKEGYGLAWNKHSEGKLISGSDDGLICLYDINIPETSSNVEPLRTFKEHTSIVEDVQFHPHNENWFGSAGDDMKVKIWDILSPESSKISFCAHKAEINSLSFNPFKEFLLLSGSVDKTVCLWDLRNTSSKLHVFEGHQQQIFNVRWSNHSESLFASCGADRRVNVYDSSKIGVEQAPEDAEDGPPELLFIHGGHTDRISDFDFNCNEEMTIASVADDNVLQIWEIAEAIYVDDDEEEVNDEDLE